MQDKKVKINSQLIRITRIFSFLNKTIEKEIVITFFMMFFNAEVLLFKK